MAAQLHLTAAKSGVRAPPGAPGQIDGAGKNKARSEQESLVRFKRHFEAVLTLCFQALEHCKRVVLLFLRFAWRLEFHPRKARIGVDGEQEFFEQRRGQIETRIIDLFGNKILGGGRRKLAADIERSFNPRNKMKHARKIKHDSGRDGLEGHRTALRDLSGT